MANITYDSPSSLAPQIGFQPNGFLGGMWAGQRNQNYQEAVGQSNLMKALAAKEELNKLQEYNQNASVRQAQRLADIAGFNAKASTIGDIEAGRAAQGRGLVETTPSNTASTLSANLSKIADDKLKAWQRPAQLMSLYGPSLIDPSIPLPQRLSEYDQLKKQFPQMHLPEQYDPNAIAGHIKTAQAIQRETERRSLVVQAAKDRATMERQNAVNKTNERIQAAHDAARIQATNAAAQRAQTLEKRLDDLMNQKYGNPKEWTPDKEAYLKAIQHERDIAMAAKMATLGVTTGMLNGGIVNPSQIGTDAAAAVGAMRGQPQSGTLDWNALPSGQ